MGIGRPNCAAVKFAGGARKPCGACGGVPANWEAVLLVPVVPGPSEAGPSPLPGVPTAGAALTASCHVTGSPSCSPTISRSTMMQILEFWSWLTM